MQDPESHTTWYVYGTDQPNTHDIDQGMCNTLMAPITVVSNADITHCKTLWIGQQQHRVPYATWRELNEQGEAFMHILQRIIFPARFEDAMCSECKVIFMWYDGLNKALTYVTFNRDEYPRV